MWVASVLASSAVRCTSDFKEARPAIHGPALRGIERHGRDNRTAGTLGRDLYSLLKAGGLSDVDSRKAFVLQLFAGFASFRWVLKPLVAKEDLFADGPDELAGAIDASDRLIIEPGLIIALNDDGFLCFSYIGIRHIQKTPAWYRTHFSN